MPSEVRFAEVRRLVERAGWVLVRIRGSHHVFKRPKGMIYVIPVHHGMVKYAYVREIKRLIEEEGG
jgi:predicted RNA binding protein YcfA (HicA-like mRNA interferase family)